MEKKTYICPYCGIEHKTPSELAHCILSCESKKKIEEENKRKKQLEAEKNSRKEVIEAKQKELNKLISSYIKDYGSYSSTRSYHIANQDNTLNFLDWLFE